MTAKTPVTRQDLIESGLRIMKDFGYPDVNRDTIVTDPVYGIFFKKLLAGTKEDARGRKDILDACDGLLAEIEAANP